MTKTHFDINHELHRIQTQANDICSSELDATNCNLNGVISSCIFRETRNLVIEYSSIISTRDFVQISKFIDSFTPDPFIMGLFDNYFDEDAYRQDMQNVKNRIKGIYQVEKRKKIANYISLSLSLIAVIISIIALFID